MIGQEGLGVFCLDQVSLGTYGHYRANELSQVSWGCAMVGCGVLGLDVGTGELITWLVPIKTLRDDCILLMVKVSPAVSCRPQILTVVLSAFFPASVKLMTSRLQAVVQVSALFISLTR